MNVIPADMDLLIVSPYTAVPAGALACIAH